MRAMMTKMSNARIHTSWILMPALASIGCGSLWSPFLGDNPICQTDPATCAPPSDIGVSDGGVGADMMDPEIRPNLVMVRKGSFMMGSPTGEVGRNTDEVQHSVTLTTDFWMAESEVTQKQYRNLMGGPPVPPPPSSFQGDAQPVVAVTWFDAVAYCNALSVKENLAPMLSDQRNDGRMGRRVEMHGVSAADRSGVGVRSQPCDSVAIRICRLRYGGWSGVV